MKLVSTAACLALLSLAKLHAQQPMGYIATADARISGSLDVTGSRARLLSNVSLTAYDHTAAITLDRGGELLVCATTDLHLLHSGTADSLLVALDRGALELRSASRPQDAILTPDLRFTILAAGTLDLRLRVTREGDTCVDNHGDTAPILNITQGFGDATYRLAPGQHVLFEHGSLREVVDNERSHCGCPSTTPSMTAIAAAANATNLATPQQVAALNPFPTDQSAGLSATPPAVAIPAQLPAEATLRVGPAPASTTPPSPGYSAAVPPPQANPVSTTPPPAPPGVHDIAHAIGGFFRRIFHRQPKPAAALQS